MTEPANKDRAERARRAMEEGYNNEDYDLTSDVTDLLTDLLHLCDCSSIMFEDSLRLARDHYAEEVSDELK